MGWIAPDLDSRLVGRHGIRSIHRSPIGSPPSGFADRESRSAINAFNDIASGRNARRRLRESNQKAGPEAGRPGMIDCALPSPPINKDEFIRNLRLLGSGTVRAGNSVDGNAPVCKQQRCDGRHHRNSSFPARDAGGTIQRSTPGAKPTRINARSQVIDGLNWWVE